MKKINILIFIAVMFIAGCEGVCQPVGYYEKCVANGWPVCVDIYPKCPCEEKEIK